MGATPSRRPSDILFGQTRRAVLRLLFGHADRPFYLRQIARATKAGMGAVQREVQQLAEAGILRRSQSGNQVFYQADRESSIFAELKGLIIKTAGVVDVLREALGPLRGRIRVAFVYGSFARQEEQAASDVDLFVVGSAPFGELVAGLQAAQRTLGREIAPVVFPVGEFRAKLKRRDHFLASVLQQPKLFVMGDAHELARVAAKRMAAESQVKPRRNPRSAGNRGP